MMKWEHTRLSHLSVHKSEIRAQQSLVYWTVDFLKQPGLTLDYDTISIKPLNRSLNRNLTHTNQKDQTKKLRSNCLQFRYHRWVKKVKTRLRASLLKTSLSTAINGVSNIHETLRQRAFYNSPLHLKSSKIKLHLMHRKVLLL